MSADIEALLQRWSGIVRSAARRYGFNPPEEDELTQDLRIRLWRALSRQGENRGGLAASYVYQAAMSAATDLLRRRRRDRRHVGLDAEVAAPPGTGVASPSSSDILDVLDAALQALGPDRRVAVRLHLEGKSRDEIAVITGWSEARTRNLLYRGLTDLRASLDPHRGAP
jgi:RNA polymerase sigma-70 factor (ECF subfamily)